MQENFVGYVLNALDLDEHWEVEVDLRDDPEARRQVALLRQALEPLEADAAEVEPPSGLAARTLARLAEHCCLGLPRAPASSRRSGSESSPRWWRRSDVLVAASLLLCCSLLIPPVINYLQQRQQIESCKNNLRNFGVALISYSDDHRRAFPNVADPRFQPRNVAGMVVPVLLDSGRLNPEDVTTCCPGNGAPARCRLTVNRLLGMSKKEFQDQAPRLAGCYAYTLGYTTPNGIQGYTHDDSVVPLMADRPPFRQAPGCHTEGNSLNHRGTGQNVLFTDGHVAFLTSRSFGGDDIYLNREDKVAPGKDPRDIVLGVSEARLDSGND